MYYYTDTVVFSSLVSVCVTREGSRVGLGDAAREADGRKNDNGRKNESSDVS
jgi:hypothetical protein